MSPERWHEIQRVLDGALDRSIDERVAFIAESCGDDADLCDRVVRLVNACERAERRESVLATPAAELALPMLADLAAVEERRRAAVMDTLTSALASRYAVERLIGQGGMSAVFLARDLRHDRAVALKVLARDVVAPSGVERFLQEIRVTARLSHPHILPVHDSGEAEGLLYYVMPYVDGETLRRRLNSGDRLSLVEAVRILRELADALAFAHARGVVHRDLKPENVLLSGGHAVVGDFGIAKALTAAADKRNLPVAESAFSPVVLGTPAYMAPEQVEGSAGTDHRSDIYAFGVVAYELLAGTHPFAGRSPRAMVKAQLDETPEPLDTIRPGLPPPLARLVMRCLAKSPTERPDTADTVRASLDESLRELGSPRRRLTRHAVGTGLIAAGALAVAAGLWLALRPDRSLLTSRALVARQPLLVADFQSVGTDSGMGPALGRMFGRYLAESRLITVMTQGQIDSVLRLMRRSPGAPLDPELAREVALRAGVRAVITGDLARLGPGYLVSVRLVSAATGEELAYYHANAADDDAVIPALDRMGRDIRGRIGESIKEISAGPPLRMLTTLSLEALRTIYTASTTSDFERRVALLREAIALDTTFAYAYLSLANALIGVRRGSASRDSAVTRAYQLRDHLTQSERTVVTAFYWNLPGRDRLRVIAAYEAQVARDVPDWRSILNLGLALNSVRRFARTESLMVHYEPVVDWRGSMNLALAQAGQGRVGAADSTNDRLEKRRRRYDAFVLQSRAAVALAAMRFDSAALFTKQWRAIPHTNSSVPPLEILIALARARGRLGDARVLTSEADALSIGIGMPFSVLAAHIATASEDLWLRGRPADAQRRLDSLFKVRPVASLGTAEDRIHGLRAAALYAASGRPDRARLILTSVLAAADSLERRALHSHQHAALAEIAMAEGRPQDAMSAFLLSDVAADGLPVSACVVCVLPGLARALDRAGMADSALTLWERYVTTPSPERLESDSWFLAMAYRELRRLHTAAGNSAKAADFDRRLADLWRNADSGVGRPPR